jgi:DnaK suppressor protein
LITKNLRIIGNGKLLDTYMPSEEEEFMNPDQIKFFYDKLLSWKDDLTHNSQITIQNLQEENIIFPDNADRASSETDRSLELRTRDRQRKLISKIDQAIKRIDEGTYGYCEETGDPISIGRLIARPTATLSVEAQERHERKEKVFRYK